MIATEHGSYRLKALKTGEVALYTDEGAKIVLKRGRLIETDCDVFKVNCKTWEVNASDKADFNTPMLSASEQVTAGGQLNGNGGWPSRGAGAHVEGTLEATVDVIAAGKSGAHHIHDGDSGGKPVSPINSQELARRLMQHTI